MIQYHINQCNALGRALPKLTAKMYRTDPESRAWDEAYHVVQAVVMRWRDLQRQIAEETAPWFDGSAFQQEPLSSAPRMAETAERAAPSLERLAKR